jgi:hypothetical protein
VEVVSRSDGRFVPEGGESHLAYVLGDRVDMGPYVKLSQLTAEDLENLYERKLDEGVGVATVRYVHTTIKTTADVYASTSASPRKSERWKGSVATTRCRRAHQRAPKTPFRSNSVVQTVVFRPNFGRNADAGDKLKFRFAGNTKSALGRTRTCDLLIRSDRFGEVVDSH